MIRAFRLVQVTGNAILIDEEILFPRSQSKFQNIRNAASKATNDIKKILSESVIWKCRRCETYGVTKKNSIAAHCFYCKKIMESRVDHDLSKKLNYTAVNVTKQRFKEKFTVA